MYNRPVLSPDGKRVAVAKSDLDKETNDIWVIEVATGQETRITTTQPREGANTPVWSPDGSQVAYVRLSEGFPAIFRKAATGVGDEELLYRHRAPVDLTDWSMDGRYLSFFSSNLAGGALYSVPLAGTGERKPIEIFTSTFQLRAPRLSPDGRFVVYVSNPSGKDEIYVRPFDPAGAPSSAEPVQISDQGGAGMPIWRRDGKELYYLGANGAVMVVDVTTTPAFKAGRPSVLFRLSEETPVTATMANVGRDGERVLIAVPPPQLAQMIVFDRQGKVVGRVGSPGRFAMPSFSPDGTRVAVLRQDPDTGNRDIWTFDVATGNGAAVTNDVAQDDMHVWSPDGKQLAYFSLRGSDASLYRKASDGTGQEELLFRYTPGTFMGLTDWSRDGKFLTFFTGVLAVLPVGSSGASASERKEIEWLREEYDAVLGRFSPDSRLLAYLSNEAKVDTMQLYVRPFDAGKPEAPGPGPVVQVSKEGALGMVAWRQDGRELYYMNRNWEVMAVEVTTTPTLQAGPAKLLFKVPALPGPPGSYMTRDGQRFILAVPSSAAIAR
jgi:Tol biopolymer transport system component